MKDTPRDYTNITNIVSELGFIPINTYRGAYKGLYQKGNKIVDLSASAENKESILKNIIRQINNK